MNTADRGAAFVSVEGSIATVVLNRPEKKNALNTALIAALKEAFESAATNPSVKVVALRGAGADFCSGMDLGSLSRLADASLAENLEDVDSLADLFMLMRRLPQPLVALVKGRALAGGCGLATACDLVLAEESATFGYTETRIGFVPAMVAALLRRSVSEKKAFELIALGDLMTAREAERIGLINRVYADEDFEASAALYLNQLAERSASAVQLSKRSLYQQDGLGFESAVRAGADMNVLARTTEDLRVGVERFLAERRARSSGR